ncbi:4211_t:CDS:1, partial [Acaulospora colombiana]
RREPENLNEGDSFRLDPTILNDQIREVIERREVENQEIIEIMNKEKLELVMEIVERKEFEKQLMHDLEKS